MALILDARQRAMLEAMRVPVWLPQVVPFPAAEATRDAVLAEPTPQARPDAAAGRPLPAAANAHQDSDVPLPQSPTHGAGAGAPAPAPAPEPASVPGAGPRPAVAQRPDPAAAAAPRGSAAGYTLLPLLQPWEAAADAPVWLVVTEVDEALAEPFPGDCGRLLQAMLRALGLHRGAGLHLARLLRAGTAPPAENAADALAHGIDQLRPAVVLALGRSAARAVLGRDEPLGRLRAQVHQAGGVPVVVSYDPAWLLRAPADKPRAWADLCLARLAAQAGGPPAAAAYNPPP